MRGTTLVKLLDMYRAEARMSLNVGHNAGNRDAQIAHIQRVQEWLWEDFDWPLLRVERFLELQAGQRTYSPPSDMHVDRVQKVELYYETAWVPLHAGIDDVHFTAYNSELDERSWPPQRWRLTENEDIEIWPIPEENYDSVTQSGRVKLTGIKNLSPLVADTDTADLDDRLIVLFCAAEVLAAQGAKDAGLKLQQANARYSKLRGAQMPRKKFKAFTQDETRRVERFPIAIYRS